MKRFMVFKGTSMTNHDRLLQFLYDSKHVRRKSLTDLNRSTLSFYMVTYDDEKLVYVGNGGDKTTLYVFTLKGRFKYSTVRDIPGAASSRQNERDTRRFRAMFPGRTDSEERPIELSGDGTQAPNVLHPGDAILGTPDGSVPEFGVGVFVDPGVYADRHRERTGMASCDPELVE